MTMVVAMMQTIDEFVEAYRKIAGPGASRDAAYWWREMDRVLTEMCRAHPDHEDVYEVFAKVSIINRMYRANLQMGANDPEWLVSQALVDNRADRIIAPLRTLDSFSATTLSAVVQVHRGVTD